MLLAMKFERQPNPSLQPAREKQRTDRLLSLIGAWTRRQLYRRMLWSAGERNSRPDLTVTLPNYSLAMSMIASFIVISFCD